jgi:hypothetical protein
VILKTRHMEVSDCSSYCDCRPFYKSDCFDIGINRHFCKPWFIDTASGDEDAYEKKLDSPSIKGYTNDA